MRQTETITIFVEGISRHTGNTRLDGTGSTYFEQFAGEIEDNAIESAWMLDECPKCDANLRGVNHECKCPECGVDLIEECRDKCAECGEPVYEGFANLDMNGELSCYDHFKLIEIDDDDSAAVLNDEDDDEDDEDY